MVYGWKICSDGRRQTIRFRKITINVGYVDLGHIDLLVREGFYANRTDLIRTRFAIRSPRTRTHCGRR